MKIVELELNNFGVYRGRNTIPLAPRSPERNIVLVGGMNGRGKTTILDAVQISLYGQRSSLVTGKKEYESLLRSRFSRNAKIGDLFSLALTFELHYDGKPALFRINRSWEFDDSDLLETVEIFRGGELDLVLTENSNDFIEEVLPLDISGLFLFDGEKIESLADPSKASKIILTAVNALLGTGLIARLQSDLKVIERRKLNEVTTTEIETMLAPSIEKLGDLEAERSRLAIEIASLQNSLDRQRMVNKELESQFEREGGIFFQGRYALENEKKDLEVQMLEVDSSIREMASGALPLLVVEDLLGALAKSPPIRRPLAEAEIHTFAREIAQSLIDSKILDSNTSEPLQKIVLDILSATTRNTLAPLGSPPDSIDLAKGFLSASSDLRDELISKSSHRETLASSNLILERKLMAVPSEVAIQDLLEKKNACSRRLVELETHQHFLQERKDHLSAEIEKISAEVEGKRRDQAISNVNAQDASRMIRSCEKAREALEDWKQAIHNRNVSRIQDEILTAYRSLLGKSNLAAKLILDPNTCEPSIRTTNGDLVHIEGLSAGERQLFAVATLWGLARVSGLNLPAIIDTPLGRLDSIHRYSLVDDYFPHAAKQVVLLSTDKEIDEELRLRLERHLSHTIELRFDDIADASTVLVDSYIGGPK